MRKIGAHVSSAGGIINAVTNTQIIGGNCMQIFAGSPRMWKRRLYSAHEAESFKQAVKNKGFNPVFIHALYLTNLASDNSELRDKSKDALITDMTNSSAIGSAGVILHIGSHQGRGFDSVKDMVISELQEILDDTPSDSTLILENTAGQKGKIGSLQELGFILQQLDSDRVKICLDTAHAFQAGHQLNNDKGLDEFIAEVNKRFSMEDVVVLHLNDSRTPLASGRDIHENLGEGQITRNGIKLIINHPDFIHLPLILEVPGFDKKGPDKKNLDIVKDLLK